MGAAASLVVLFASLLIIIDAGDADPIYKRCAELYVKTGCIMNQCFQSCNLSDGKPKDTPRHSQESLRLRWKDWDCHCNCRYYCMLLREEHKVKLGDKPIKYHGRWPFRCVYSIQRANGKTYYEHTWFWHLYGVLAMNSWFWNVVFHGRYLDLTERLYYSSAVASLGYSLILSILHALDIRAEAARVMVAAPLIAFVTTHILFLNLVELDYTLNMVVVVALVALQLLFCAAWSSLSRPPSRWKLCMVIVGGTVSMLVGIFDFSLCKDLVDTHAVRQAITVPLTSFVELHQG